MRSKVQSALASPARMVPVSSRHSSREHGGLEHRRILVTVELFTEAGPMVAGGDTLTVGSPIGELTVENSFTVTTDVVTKVKSTVARTLNLKVAMCSLLVPTIPVSEIPPNRILPGNSSTKDAAVKSPGPTSAPLPTSASSLNPTMVTSSRTVLSNSTDTSTAPTVTPSAFRNTRTSTEFPASSSACKRPSMSTSPNLGRRSTEKTISRLSMLGMAAVREACSKEFACTVTKPVTLSMSTMDGVRDENSTRLGSAEPEEEMKLG